MGSLLNPQVPVRSVSPDLAAASNGPDMSVRQLHPCPSCGRSGLVSHCASKTCDWIKCSWCKAYGAVDFARWVAEAPKA